MTRRPPLLPIDAADALLLGRVHDPVSGGPAVVTVRGDTVADISHVAPTVSHLLERDDAAQIVRTAPASRSWTLDEVTGTAKEGDEERPRLLSPIDLQVIKAAGVTFAGSMLERVIEERAQGDPSHAAELRRTLSDTIGSATIAVVPGSAEAVEVKRQLVKAGLWSQYLEVGIGPDPEIFTKAPVLSSVGWGSPIGVLARSDWNNPEPELVLVADSHGRPRGVTLGNDVNLRDFEGRSALLLGEAKDNNASCAIGPFVRLLDRHFSLDDARRTQIVLEVMGADGFTLRDVNSVDQISRSFEELLRATCGRHHQYPDGFVLFTGTLFAPTQDRGHPGAGFTHHTGDVVTIASDRLGMLRNTVVAAEEAPPWTFGLAALLRHLTRDHLPNPSPTPLRKDPR